MINIDANKGKNNNKYTDKYYWYPKGNSTTHKENQDTYYGAFYACDVVNFEETEQQMNGISDRGFEQNEVHAWGEERAGEEEMTYDEESYILDSIAQIKAETHENNLMLS